MSAERTVVAPEDWAGPLHERPGLFLRRWQVDGEPIHPAEYSRAMAELTRPTEDDPDTEPELEQADDAPQLPDADPMRVVRSPAELEGQPGVPGRGGPKAILDQLGAKSPDRAISGVGWSWEAGLGLGWTFKQQREGGHIGSNGRLTGYKINVHALFRTATCSLRLAHVSGLHAVALWGAVGMYDVGDRHRLPHRPGCCLPGGWSSVKYLGGWAWTLGDNGRPGDIPTSVPALCFTPRCWAETISGPSTCKHANRATGWPWTSSHIAPDPTERAK